MYIDLQKQYYYEVVQKLIAMNINYDMYIAILTTSYDLGKAVCRKVGHYYAMVGTPSMFGSAPSEIKLTNQIWTYSYPLVN